MRGRDGLRAASALAATAAAIIGLLVACESRGASGARATAERPAAAADSAAVAAVVERYHDALTSGDSAAALALLASDAVILESGGLETREEYRSHHLPADIAFARAVPGTRGSLRALVHGDIAWVTSTSTAQGQYRGQPVNSTGAELMVLSRERDGWKIRAIHWSSRTRPTARSASRPPS